MSKKEEKAKQGEDSKITKTSEGNEKDFKAPGIEGTKDEGGETIEEENARLKEENAKLKSEIRNPKSLAQTAPGQAEIKEAVTIEDVLPGLREKGYKI